MVQCVSNKVTQTNFLSYTWTHGAFTCTGTHTPLLKTLSKLGKPCPSSFLIRLGMFYIN